MAVSSSSISIFRLISLGPSGLLWFGLVCMFIGERALGNMDTARNVFTGLGLLCIVGAAVVRVFAYMKAAPKTRQLERTILFCYLGVALSLTLYFLSTKTGVGILGIEEEKSVAKFDTAATVVWVILLVSSLLPLLLVEFTVGMSGWRRIVKPHKSDDSGVETFRVREAATNGLTIAFALSFLMVTCGIANERNIRKDVSYFKTSSPGSATVNIVKSMNEDLKVLLFFPEVNEVQVEVEGYFDELNSKTGRLVIENHDRMASPTLAKEHKVNRDGTIVLVRGDKSEKFTIKTDIKTARRKELREFDEKVQQSLMKVIREKKVAYFTTGHGELNDAGEDRPLVAENPALKKASVIKNWLKTLNYQVKDLGIGKPIPEDASVVMVLAPMNPLLPEEYQLLDDYLAKGGAVLFALDPIGAAGLGPLEGRLGVKFNPQTLADDKEFLRRRGAPVEHQYILTNQFSAHASVTTASRGKARSGIVMFNAGSLDDAEFTTQSKQRKRTYTVRSVTSTWRDTNGNNSFDKDTEKRQRYNLVAAIEDPSALPEKAPEGGGAERGMRAIVVADGEIFSDALMHPKVGLPLVQALVIDAIKWLGGEEEFIGETKDEKDKAIVHSSNEEKFWFYLTIFGVPLLVFGLGLLMMLVRRRGRKA